MYIKESLLLDNNLQTYLLYKYMKDRASKKQEKAKRSYIPPSAKVEKMQIMLTDIS